MLGAERTLRQRHDVIAVAATREPRHTHGSHGASEPTYLGLNHLVDAATAAIRQRLIDEEVGELAAAGASGTIEEFAHELADVVYVAYGTALTYGIDLDAVIAEVHRANMTKLGPNGRPVVKDDKIQKGPCYQPPDIRAALTGSNDRVAASPPLPQEPSSA
jgi:NTP pyrophosphatase (non-canonical NTP hydrolase)